MRIAAKQRSILYGCAVGLTLLTARFAGGEDPPSQPPPSPTVRVAPAAATSSEALPGVLLDRLAPRAAQAPAGDPFEARSWQRMAEEESRRAAPPPSPPPAQAPPLPFAFMGRLIDAGAVTVFLTRDDRNYVVRAGDTLDGAYAVEAIEDDRVVFAYLPLRLRQTLAVPASPPAPSAGKRPARDDDEDD